MTDKYLINQDPLTGVYQVMHRDNQERKTSIETVQDVGPHLEAALAMRNDPERKKRGIKAGWMHAAMLPNGVVVKWMNEGRINPRPFSQEGQADIMKILRTDPNYAYLKTIDGRI